MVVEVWPWHCLSLILYSQKIASCNFNGLSSVSISASTYSWFFQSINFIVMVINCAGLWFVEVQLVFSSLGTASTIIMLVQIWVASCRHRFSLDTWLASAMVFSSCLELLGSEPLFCLFDTFIGLSNANENVFKGAVDYPHQTSRSSHLKSKVPLHFDVYDSGSTERMEFPLVSLEKIQLVTITGVIGHVLLWWIGTEQSIFVPSMWSHIWAMWCAIGDQ